MSNLNYILAFYDLSGQQPTISVNLDEIDPRRDGGKVNTFFLKSNQYFLTLNVVDLYLLHVHVGYQHQALAHRVVLSDDAWARRTDHEDVVREAVDSVPVPA